VGWIFTASVAVGNLFMMPRSLAPVGQCPREALVAAEPTG